MKLLEVDEKWSIAYDPCNNDRPTHWFRYGEMHNSCDFNNPCLSMFYSLLEAKKNLLDVDYSKAVSSWEGCVDRQGGSFDWTDRFYDEWSNE